MSCLPYTITREQYVDRCVILDRRSAECLAGLCAYVKLGTCIGRPTLIDIAMQIRCFELITPAVFFIFHSLPLMEDSDCDFFLL